MWSRSQAIAPGSPGLLARYGIGYVVVGPLEHTTYGDGGDAKWAQLGRRVYSRGGTTVWALR